MSKTSSILMMLVLAAAGLVSGYIFNNWAYETKQTGTKVSKTTEVTRSDIRPLFKLKDLADKTRDIKEWDGQVLMLNFWATWCPPCRKEMPAFIQLQTKYAEKGFKIIGIAIDEKQAVIDFTNPMAMNYTILLAEQTGVTLSQVYGNHQGVLPYTVIVDRKSRIINRLSKELTFEAAEALIKPLL